MKYYAYGYTIAILLVGCSDSCSGEIASTDFEDANLQVEDAGYSFDASIYTDASISSADSGTKILDASNNENDGGSELLSDSGFDEHFDSGFDAGFDCDEDVDEDFDEDVDEDCDESFNGRRRGNRRHGR